MLFPPVRFSFGNPQTEKPNTFSVSSHQQDKDKEASLFGNKTDVHTFADVAFNLKSELVDIYTHYAKPSCAPYLCSYYYFYYLFFACVKKIKKLQRHKLLPYQRIWITA